MQLELFPPTIDQLCRWAMEGITEHVNRSAGQHCFHITMGFRDLQERVWNALL